jgi:hypothetical protein
MKLFLSNYKINSNSEKKAISEYFIDITYKCKPKSIYKYKLVLILGYDIVLSKPVICCFALIVDKLTTIFNFLFYLLNQYYNFQPKIITCDVESSIRKSSKIIFPDVHLFPCYYHYIQNIKKNLLKTFNYNKDSKIDFYNIYVNY